MFVDSLARDPRHRSVECGSPRQGAPDRPKVRSPASDPSRPYATSDPHQPSCGEDSTRNGSLPTSFASVSRLSFHRFARSFPHSPQAHNSTPSFSASCAPLVPSSAPERKSTPLLSCACALFCKNTGGTPQNSYRLLDCQFSLRLPGVHHGGTAAHLRQSRFCQPNSLSSARAKVNSFAFMRVRTLL